MLVRHFVARYAAERRVATPEVSAEAIAALQAYDWPGNVRQLRNVVERTIIMAPGDRLRRIDADMLPAEVLSDQARLARAMPRKSIMGTPLREARETFEREYLRVQIRRFSGNIHRAPRRRLADRDGAALGRFAPAPVQAQGRPSLGLASMIARTARNNGQQAGWRALYRRHRTLAAPRDTGSLLSYIAVLAHPRREDAIAAEGVAAGLERVDPGGQSP